MKSKYIIIFIFLVLIVFFVGIVSFEIPAPTKVIQEEYDLEIK
tara:strand:+ start:304 stop:432 length:129 start_codon:yes stop_codon:yes gene_type:complete